MINLEEYLDKINQALEALKETAIKKKEQMDAFTKEVNIMTDINNINEKANGNKDIDISKIENDF